MSMHGSYDEYGQDNDTADLVRSVALSSAKLWEEVFERLRRLEDAQVELRAMLGRIEGQLPAGPANAAIGSGVATRPAWPDRAIEAPGPVTAGYDAAHTDLFVPDPEGDVTGTVGHGPRDAIDLLVGSGPSPVTPEMPEDEPPTFFFPPAPEAAVSTSDAAGASDLDTGWPGSDLLGSPGWTSPHTIRYDEGFTSRDVVGPPTEEVQAVDMAAPERSNAEYFGRHAAGPPPGFAVANGEVPPSGFEPDVPQVQVPQVQVPQVQVPQVADVEPPFDPEIDQQLQQAAQAVEMQATTGPGPATVPAPPFGFATETPGVDPAAPAFEAWNDNPDALRVPLVFAPGDGPATPAGESKPSLPSSPPGFADSVGVAPPPPPGFGSITDVPVPAPGFASGPDVEPASPPPPPAGFASGPDIAPPPPPPGFESAADIAPPPPPPGFGSAADIAPPPPPPPGFASGPESAPSPPLPPGFGSMDFPSSPPLPPPGFESASAIGAPPPPPPGFTGGPDIAPPPPPPGFASGTESVPPPPPPGFGVPGTASPVDDVVPPPLGFALGGDQPVAANDGQQSAAPPPPPPPGFATDQGVVNVGAATAPLPPPGFSTTLPESPAAPPPPPPGFAPGAGASYAGSSRTPSVSGSIADDVLAISSITPPAEEAAATGAASGGNGNGHGNGNGNGNGHGPAEDGPPPPITPDFFARAGRRRR